MNKKAQLDLEILSEPGFWLLSLGAIAATMIGYIISKKSGIEAFPLWQLIAILVGEVIASYFIAWRMSS